MLTEEPHITINQLCKRWEGMNYREIGKKIASLIEDCQPFPQPFQRRGPERLNNKTGSIVWDVEPLTSVPYCFNSTDYDLDGICFKAADIEHYEENHSEVFQQLVDADDQPDPSTTPASEYITAEEAQSQLKMSPAMLVRHLWKHREELPLPCLVYSNDRAYFYDPGPRDGIEGAIHMLDQIFIHRLDWEKHLKDLEGHVETKAPGGAEEEAFKARLAEVVADYKAKLKRTEDELAQAKQALTKAEETAKAKSTDKATIARLRKQLWAWKDAPAWMIPAAIDVVRDGPKGRSRAELRPFVEEANGQTEGVYFEAWRLALPDGYYDKDDRSSLSQIDDEPLEE